MNCMAPSHEPTEELTNRLAAHLRGPEQAKLPGASDDGEGLFDEPASPTQQIIQAERSAILQSGPTAAQEEAAEAARTTPFQSLPGKSAATLIKNLASRDESGSRSTRLRRAISVPEHHEQSNPVDPSQMPPPVRKGFTVATPVRVNHNNGPTVVTNPSKRDLKRNEKEQRRQAKMAKMAAKPIAPAEILDQRMPGKYREDTPFLLPMIPSMLIAGAAMYCWFQGAIRFSSLLPLTPIIIGVMVGGVMRMGSRTVDFARIIFAVMITAFATFWGHAAIASVGPLNELAKIRLEWSDVPRVKDTTRILPVFREMAERSLGTAALMFGGLIAAGLVSSVRSR